MVAIPYWAAYQENWLLEHIAIFDGPNKTIRIAEHTSGVNIEIELYSDWKEWTQLTNDVNTRWDAAFRTVGGDPTEGGDALGATFFLINGWQIILDHGVVFTGNLFSDDFDSPYRTEDGVELAFAKVSNLIDKPAIALSDSDLTNLSNSVWSRLSTDNTVSGTMGALQNLLARLDTTISTIPASVWVEPAGSQVVSSSVLAQGSTVSGSTAAILRTNISEGNGFYDGLFVRVSDIDSGSVTRGIDGYLNVSGTFYLDSDLPFTPSTGSNLLILASAHRSSFGNVG